MYKRQGSHNAAAQARSLWLEDHPNSNVHIFNSCSASAGEVLVALKIQELAQSGMDFTTVVSQVSRYINEMETYFVLETLDNLRKNGRLTRVQSLVTSCLLYTSVFIDTAGRLHVDEELMEQLKVMKAAIDPTEILLIVDAMIGQDAVNAAKTFDEALDITGVMLTKLDGDARGGAALSIKAVTGKPIKFVGVGEKLDQVELFYPDRMASRILGMGDVLSLIEKAQQTFDAKKAAELEQKLRKNKFTLADFYDQLVQIKGMGSLSDIAGMLPGMNAKALEGASVCLLYTSRCV